MISSLLSPSRHARRHAFDRLAMNRETAYAAREILTFDDDAEVRARAARFLARAPSTIATPALRDALDDEMPLVRHAAVRALASCDASSCLDDLEKLAIEDPIWWVRRAAVVTMALSSSREVVPTLRAALEDPFWRVRNAAVKALLALRVDPGELIEDLGPATSARSAGALSYLARRLGVAKSTAEGAVDVPNAIVARLDPDPAVVAARLDRGDSVTPAFLVECLGDPHEALRVTARKRLARTHDVRAFELALIWLDEPRIPHAAQTVVQLLDGLDHVDVGRVLDIAFERGGFGALSWAASYVGLTRDASRLELLLARTNAEHPIARCSVIAALGQLGGERALAAIIDTLTDRDLRVVRTALDALFEDGGATAMSALEDFPLTRSSDPRIRRVLVAAAGERGDARVLRLASRDDDVRLRAMALTALASMGELASDVRAACAVDPDPWIRLAVLDVASAESALENDPQPVVRRAAFRILVDANADRAAELASLSDDPWLQTRACALLDPHSSADLAALLRLSRDKSPAVRAAAADALGRANVDDALDALLESARWRGEEHAEVRIAALAYRARHFDDADLARLESARAHESAAVRAWIDDVRGVAPPEEIRAPASLIEASTPRRTLGATGLRISPLVVSGAGLLPSRMYVDAMHAGCNLFFWEPRYLGLGSMLAHNADARVIAGTYEATERAIVADVERSLRRLRRDTLDVFLLFWARSPARLEAPTFDVLSRLKEQGKIGAFGFSTHDRALACDALRARRWDVVMTRHSAVHPGSEDRLFPLAHETGTGVLAFSALSYGRMLRDGVSAPDAYRYSLAQAGVSACLSSPRSERELAENLTVLASRDALSAERQRELRVVGARVHAESRDFARSIRRHPINLGDANTTELGTWLDQEEAVHEPR